MKSFQKRLSLAVLFALSSVAPAAPETNTTEASITPEKAAKASAPYSRVWGGIDIQYTPVSYPNYEWFPDTYNDKTGNGFRLGLEFIAVDWHVGKIGAGTGTGFFFVPNASFGEGKATLYTVPFEAYLSYRLDFLENQAIVPFAKIGPTYVVTHQVTNEEASSWREFYSMGYSLGGEFLLDVLDRRSAASMERNIGIRNSYLIFEYNKSRYLRGRKDANLSGEQYRLGLRFEI
jgi:hypothetical protein